MKTLDNIRFVLVGTTHPGNIGAAARAMKTMGLSNLHLVTPKIYPSAEATARASGADDVLAKAIVHDNLDSALVGCQQVYGMSARLRHLPVPVVNPREAVERIQQTSDESQIAIVFGREHSGLSNEELDRCQHLVNIPANSDYSSLNLAAAVQVIAYEFKMSFDPSIEVGRIGEDRGPQGNRFRSVRMSPGRLRPGHHSFVLLADHEGVGHRGGIDRDVVSFPDLPVHDLLRERVLH